MAIRIKSRGGESVEQMMRRFKKLCEKEGLTKDIKRKEFYEKPSERRRRRMRKTSNALCWLGGRAACAPHAASMSAFGLPACRIGAPRGC
ncbi:MAG: 30S ribosomal protein S21 [Phycisphaeraceae bacterium]|nr:30S ribosomal protein S21 [Phycisphaeraceae bacterium]